MKKYILFVFFAALANAASSQIVINSQNVESVTHSLTGTVSGAYTVPAGKMLVVTNVVFSISTQGSSGNLTIDGISVLHATTTGITHFTDVNITAGEQEVVNCNVMYGICVINGYLVTL